MFYMFSHNGYPSYAYMPNGKYNIVSISESASQDYAYIESISDYEVSKNLMLLQEMVISSY